MDILNPQVEWIEGRCYRKLPVKNQTSDPYTEEEPFVRLRSNAEDDYVGELPIKQSGGRFFVPIFVPPDLIKFIIGKNYSTKNRIEQDTATKIRIPELRQKRFDGKIKEDEVEISIIGSRGRDVANAHHQIEALLNNARWNIADHTHFISVPMNNEMIRKNFNQFKKEILANLSGSEGIDESTFESPARLHLTIAMLTLLSRKEVEHAAALLERCQTKILEWLDNNPLEVEVRGVEYMNDEPQEVKVLYGKVVEKNSNNCLQLISDLLADEFTKANFSKKEHGSDDMGVKLHVTLMKGRQAVKGGQRRFDATEILKSYANYSFGSVKVTDIHISLRYSGNMNGYWKSSSTLHLA